MSSFRYIPSRRDVTFAFMIAPCLPPSPTNNSSAVLGTSDYVLRTMLVTARFWLPSTTFSLGYLAFRLCGPHKTVQVKDAGEKWVKVKGLEVSVAAEGTDMKALKRTKSSTDASKSPKQKKEKTITGIRIEFEKASDQVRFLQVCGVRPSTRMEERNRKKSDDHVLMSIFKAANHEGPRRAIETPFERISEMAAFFCHIGGLYRWHHAVKVIFERDAFVTSFGELFVQYSAAIAKDSDTFRYLRSASPSMETWVKDWSKQSESIAGNIWECVLEDLGSHRHDQAKSKITQHPELKYPINLNLFNSRFEQQTHRLFMTTALAVLVKPVKEKYGKLITHVHSTDESEKKLATNIDLLMKPLDIRQDGQQHWSTSIPALPDTSPLRADCCILSTWELPELIRQIRSALTRSG